MLKVFALILNWNHPEATISCVQSLRQAHTVPEEIVVVDNGSRDDSAVILQKQLDGHCRVMRNPENLGYAGGLRPGIDYCLAQGADLLWLMNNDIIVQADTLERMLESVERNGLDCLYSPRVVRLDDPEHTYFAGQYFNRKNGTFDPEPCGQPKSFLHDERDLLTDVIQGSNFIVPACVVRTCGFMDENFFLYYEEFDYSLRLAGCGIKCICVLPAMVLHAMEGTPCADRPALDRVRLYYRVRNKMLIFRRYCTPACAIRLMLYTLLRQIVAVLLHRRGEPSAVFTRSKALWHGLLGKSGRVLLPP